MYGERGKSKLEQTTYGRRREADGRISERGKICRIGNKNIHKWKERRHNKSRSTKHRDIVTGMIRRERQRESLKGSEI